MDANTLIKKLGLKPLPMEGGYFAETYRCNEVIPTSALDGRYGRDRAISTAIYYLLTPNVISQIHRIISDEIFHFYAGDPVEMLQLFPDGSHEIIVLGNDIEAGQLPQVVVPRGVWQGCRLRSGGEWALMGTTVAPGFDYEDYEHGDLDALIIEYPDCAENIRALSTSEAHFL